MITHSEYTRLDEALIEALHTGEWMGREQIAHAIRRPKNQLNPHDVNRLNWLTELGVIERRYDDQYTARVRYEYRLKENKNE